MRHIYERELIIEVCQRLSDKGLVVGTAGNVSVRTGDEILISPSGVDYADLKPRDIGVFSLTGESIDAILKPSSELPLHLAIYNSTDHEAVIHTHGIASTALSTVVDKVPCNHYYSALFGGQIRVAPYSRFGTKELAEGVVTGLLDRKAVLMQNHGAAVVGEDLVKVYSLVEYLEYISEVALRAISAGRVVKELSLDEIAAVAQDLKSYGQMTGDE